MINKYLIAISLLLLTFANNAQARNTVVFGQSNAAGIFWHGGLPGNVYNCTMSGKPIEYFKFSYSQTTAFGACIGLVGYNKVDAIVFWQGESDSIAPAQWSYAASEVIYHLRKYFGVDVPIIMVVLHKWDVSYKGAIYDGWHKIREQQLGMYWVYKIDSEGYEFDAATNYNHLTIAGYQTMGKDIDALLTRLGK